MPFDPAKPAPGSQINSAELRSQFNALHDLHTTDTARNPASVAELSFAISDPPTYWEVQAIYDKVNEFIAATRRV